MLMIRPLFCFRMIGKTALTTRATPKSLTSNGRSNRPAENSSAPPGRPIPAL
jgi:hypothetical protein